MVVSMFVCMQCHACKYVCLYVCMHVFKYRCRRFTMTRAWGGVQTHSYGGPIFEIFFLPERYRKMRWRYCFLFSIFWFFKAVGSKMSFSVFFVARQIIIFLHFMLRILIICILYFISKHILHLDKYSTFETIKTINPTYKPYWQKIDIKTLGAKNR